MPRPLPDDPPPSYIARQSEMNGNIASTSSSSPPESTAPSSFLPAPSRLSSPQMLHTHRHVDISDSRPPWRTSFLTNSNSLDWGSNLDSSHTTNVPSHTTTRMRRSSASSLDPTRPTTRVRTPSPPPTHAFDSPESSTTAWLHWLEERRDRRLEVDETIANRAAGTNTVDPLGRLRQSAERLRVVEARLHDAATTTRQVTGSNGGGIRAERSDAYQESRTLLAEVRQRLDVTRFRIQDAQSRVSEDEDVNGTTEAERRAQARQGLDRTVAFANRLEQLASTLTTLSERASALSSAQAGGAYTTYDSTERSSTSPEGWSNPPPNAIEPSSSASHTDGIRNTVRQLIAASRRVSAAIDRHREASSDVAALSGTNNNRSPPLPPSDIPLRVSLPSPLETSAQATNTVAFLDETSPNPDGLLLPSRPFTRSPLSITPTSPTGPLTVTSNNIPAYVASDASLAEPGENYPGERAQLLRIASLQRDIASRALELRELRARGRELDREERESRRTMIVEGISSSSATTGEAEKEDDDEYWTVRRIGREVEVEASSSGDETVKKQPRKRSREEKRKAYELYAVCGR